MKNNPPILKYDVGLISYLSLSKVEQLHGQIKHMSIDKITYSKSVKFDGKLGTAIKVFLNVLSGEAEFGAERGMVSTKEGRINSFNKLRDIFSEIQR
jgi:hypothetical protein